MSWDQKQQTRLFVALLAVLAVTASDSGAAVIAARAPTFKEREAIIKALPKSIRDTPVECIWLRIRVSTRDSRYADVGGAYLNWEKPGSRCLRYASNWHLFLKRGKTWKIIFDGTSGPSCKLRIPRDLTPCFP
jgi:hypothetical protein